MHGASKTPAPTVNEARGVADRVKPKRGANTMQGKGGATNFMSGGIHLTCPHIWLTMEAQRPKKSASTIVLTIAGRDAATNAITSGLSLFGRKLKVQKDLTFGPDTLCNNCLAFGHQTSKCTNNIHRNLCAGEHQA